MRFGVSSACLYPEDTLAAFDILQNLDIQYIEVFVNTFSELRKGYLSNLKEHLQRANTCITSLHPFTCELETFLFATDYNTRFKDGVQMYKKYFSMCKFLDIHQMAFHGMSLQSPFPFNEHCEYYVKLRKIAGDYGVDLCYENVVRCKCGKAENIVKLREYTNDEASFLLDVKQMRRAGVTTEKMLSAMNGKIKYVHLSDCSSDNDCVVPFKGSYNFNTLFAGLKAQNFDGDIILELYRNGFETAEDLKDAVYNIKQAYEKEEGTTI
ncbi:MAG: sugar phosphate isomerase/epimerase [Oscillospiraceae bacterium]